MKIQVEETSWIAEKRKKKAVDMVWMDRTFPVNNYLLTQLSYNMIFLNKSFLCLASFEG